MVIANEDGSYTILINARSAPNKQLEAYQHALEHIKNEDFQKENVQQIEFSAHSTSHVENNAQPVPQQNTFTSEQFLERIKYLKRHRKRIRRELAQVEKDMQQLEKYGVQFFALAEERWADPG